MAKVGDTLAAPETGWRRYNNNHTYIGYVGSWTHATGGLLNQYTDGTQSYTQTQGDSIKFRFYGTRLRVITASNTDRSKDVQITVDGRVYKYQEYASVQKFMVMQFEIIGLIKGIHEVEIKKMDATTTYTTLDGIDIDADGHIVAMVGSALTAPEEGWQRFDDSVSQIHYSDNNGWSNPAYAGTYGGLTHASSAAGKGTATCTFKFYGSMLRVIGWLYTGRHTNNKISIDGIEYTYSESSTSDIRQAIVFEALGLDKKEHEVVITAGTDATNMTIDAFDIDADGYLIASVGDTLPVVEPGWRRYNNTAGNFNYVGNWTHYTGGNLSLYTEGTYSYTSELDAHIKFKFYGTKLRVITEVHSNRSKDVQITIDGQVYKYQEFGPHKYIIIAFEITDLTKGVHEVEIRKIDLTSTSTIVSLDALDVDADGYVLSNPPNTKGELKDTISEMAIGDYIPCSYFAPKSYGGYFYGLGNDDIPEINTGGESAPNGKFYFVKVRDGLLIADRVIHHTISWSQLNISSLTDSSNASIGCIPPMTDYKLGEIVVSASSELSANVPAWKAFSKIHNTGDSGWHSAPNYPHFLQVDFGKTKKIVGFSLTTRYESTYPQSPKDWKFQGSNDGAFWDDLYSVTGDLIPYASVRAVFLNSIANYRYYRVYVTDSNSTTKHVAIGQLELYDESSLRGLVRMPSGGITSRDVYALNPPMVSNTLPEGEVFASSTYSTTYPAWKAFSFTNQGYSDCWLTANGIPQGHIGYRFFSPKEVFSYFVTARSDTSTATVSPKNWTFEGSNDGQSWTVLDTVTNQTGWTNGMCRVYEPKSTGTFLYYRLNITANNGGNYTAVAGIKFLGKDYLVTDEPSEYPNGQGSYPSHNEFDRYIMKDSLNGSVETNNDAVWNHKKGIMTFCHETPRAGAMVDGAQMSNASYRTVRGGTDSALYGYWARATNGAWADAGFRPVFEYKEG